jgi:hypothetical protein
VRWIAPLLLRIAVFSRTVWSLVRSPSLRQVLWPRWDDLEGRSLVDQRGPLRRANLHSTVNGLCERLHIDMVPLVHFGDGVAKHSEKSDV